MKYEDLHNLEGLQFVPVNELKRPIVKQWQTSTAKHSFKDAKGVGLVCGIPSGNLECIDADCKYDLTGTMWERYKKIVHSIDKNLLSKLVLQKTKNGGFHLIYRCSVIAGNIKLANRPTLETERDITYKLTYEAEVVKADVTEEKARQIAEKARKGDKVRVLFETRGLGGQFVCHPTPGYEFIFGDLCSISEITPEEREILLNCAMQFNEVVQEAYSPSQKDIPKTEGLSPFDDYNQRGDVVSLLQEHGWKLVNRRGNKTHFLRPGQTTAQTSGNFDHDKNWFSVFTTSSEFDAMKAYLPYAVYAKLECGDDFKQASRKLLELGYGERKEKKSTPTTEKKTSTRAIESRIDPEINDKSYFATPDDYDDYLRQVIDGTLQMGMSTGIPSLDQHFLFKKGNFVNINGIDNVGKSEIVWWLQLLAAMYHGWKFIIFSSENTLGSFMRRMIQLFWGKPLRGEYAMTDFEFKTAKNFIEKHFKLIKAQEDLFNYKDIINLVKIALNEDSFDGGMIDPYNSLKINLSGFSKLNTHEYHYEAMSELKSFGQQNNFGWFINHHAVTSALRLKDAERKYPVAPRKEDTEGGGKVPNKSDDFLTIHRITQHPTEWMITEIHVRKIKDTETGGRPTSMDSPVKLERYKGGYAYCEWLEGGIRGIDPVQEWHWLRDGKPSNTKTIIAPPTNGWVPYKDTDIDF